MRSSLSLCVLPALLSSFLAATLPQLFQKAKEEFRFGSYAASLATLEVLERESALPEHEAARAALRPGLLFYRGASLAALGRSSEARGAFEEFLALAPNAKLDPAIYPRTVIAAFESAREGRRQDSRPGDLPSLAGAYRVFPRPERGRAEEVGESWADGPVGRLLTAEERRTFARLQDPVGQSEFVTAFWRSRDPKPETEENEWRDEFEKRVAFADSRFTQDETRGSLTDRGLVFLLMGPPSYSGRRPLRTGDDAADSSGLSRFTRSEARTASQSGGSNADRQARIEQVNGPGSKVQDAASNWVEVWHYLRGQLPKGVPYQEVVVEFVTKQGYGKDVLQRDPNVLASLERAREAIRRGPV
jgi:GWxTD domain-containing protein